MMTPSYLALVFVVLVFAHLARAEEALDPDELKLKKDYSGVHPTPYGEGYATLTWYTGMDCSQKDAGEIYTFPNNDVFPAWCAETSRRPSKFGKPNSIWTRIMCDKGGGISLEFGGNDRGWCTLGDLDRTKRKPNPNKRFSKDEAELLGQGECAIWAQSTSMGTTSGTAKVTGDLTCFSTTCESGNDWMTTTGKPMDTCSGAIDVSAAGQRSPAEGIIAAVLLMLGITSTSLLHI
eukprot:gnl/TRDRNA2_/TRDRNA2_128051_c0_seq2.p1 gnl/TRDRNA2_/TRDRNA2_128051_c0~~gnl/TRDRNA2_/TRDRNA2_128051_c0_seq2.p1  ORF type:complete len:235 (-),score=34.03 gnl/TRDRNA2_/TRDRNA2_128051_c0_seq2:59-763(-)